MYKKLKELEIDNEFSAWIDERRTGLFEKTKFKGDEFLFRKMISSMFVSGFSSQTVDKKWPTIRTVFADFNISKVSKYDEKQIRKIINTPDMIKNELKIRGVVENAKEIVKIQKDYGSFVKYIESFKDVMLLADDLKEKFSFLGNATVYDYLKEIGFNTIKPDVHVNRILERIGLISSNKLNPKTIKEVFDVAKGMSKATGENLRVIDAVIWFYGADRPDIIKKRICGEIPLCNECYLTKFCKYYKNKR